MSRFYLDLALICAVTIQVIVMKRMELAALVKMGVFKDLDAMNDREMFAEYDKMLKQSTKVRVQYKDRKVAKEKEGNSTISNVHKFSINHKDEEERGEWRRVRGE